MIRHPRKPLIGFLLLSLVIAWAITTVEGEGIQEQRRIYPDREREQNILLIKAVIFAKDEQSRTKALTEFTGNMHPSVFAELDWMERSVPFEQREKAAKMIDYLFLETLAQNVALRRSQFDWDDKDLAREVLENRDFFEYILTRGNVRNVLGSAFITRVKRHLESTKQQKEAQQPRG